WETVDVFGNHGLGGLLEEGAHGKSPKCLGGNLGDFGDFAKVSICTCVCCAQYQRLSENLPNFSGSLITFSTVTTRPKTA
ncbi:hypothetical protein, partial [Neisseria meningitidis]|uniref:hypothetical protein n=2 Tax=Neisseria meningitidis TaxID=487 RepID=UPI0019596793